jgi:hypothetical protein
MLKQVGRLNERIETYRPATQQKQTSEQGQNIAFSLPYRTTLPSANLPNQPPSQEPSVNGIPRKGCADLAHKCVC